MADLENLLLEAAGRTNGKNSRKSSASDRSCFRGKDSEDNRDYSRKKEASSQIPFKKRYEHTKTEGPDHDNHDNYEDDSDVGSDLYKDDDDRNRLAEMTELEREMILSDRASKKDDRSLKQKLKQKNKEGAARAVASTFSRSSRSSARNADRAAAMGSVLSQLREKRLKQKDSRGTLDGTEEKCLSPTSLSSYDGDEEDDDDDDDDDEDDGVMAESDDYDDEGGNRMSDPPLFEDIKGVTIRRSKLAKWLVEPFFEDLIAGCFVRMGIGNSKSGPVYRLCEVQSVDSSDLEMEYKVEGKSTHKCLICFWGNESSATKWKMAMVSDSAPTEEEFGQWAREVERSGGRKVSRKDVLEKAESIEQAHTYVYSATAVKQMLEEKKQAWLRPVNVAVEKDRLRRMLEVAESRSDRLEVERITGKLAELEASRQAQDKDSKAVKLAEMNKRNKAENFKNASERPSSKSLRAGDEGYDPFSRRWTRSRNYYDAKAGGQGSEAALGVDDTEVGMALDGVGGGCGAGKSVETSAWVGRRTKPITLHDFDISISEEVLKSLGGHHGAYQGYMVRKQRIEAAIGLRVLENDGKRHAQTITVSDYKRRRGLL